jgi:hypothetical protein
MSSASRQFTAKNVELAVVRDGYSALAAWLACYSDNETLIFRQFSNLASRNILHLQAQVVALEEGILDADAAARRHDAVDGVLVSSMRWETLMRNSKDVNRPEHKRVQHMEHLKDLLKNYCTTCLPRI